MNNLLEKGLNFSRRKYFEFFSPSYAYTGKSKYVNNIEYGNKLIMKALTNSKPVLIGRIGTTECGTLLNYLGIRSGQKSNWKYVNWKQEAWWWNWSSKNGMNIFSGFFPTTDENLTKFCQLMLKDLEDADILISLTYAEEYLKEYFHRAQRLTLPSMEPYFSINPWTHALKGKKVLVVHPMVETFKRQWMIREKIWPDGMMPDFELKTIKAVQTVAGEKSEFKDWFEALEWMKQEISKVDFDICIIGAGAYGFPLAAHVKRIGKKAVHMAGATQLLFGVKGRRWETDPSQPFTNFMNEFWVRPEQAETPKNANLVEGGCYW